MQLLKARYWQQSLQKKSCNSNSLRIVPGSRDHANFKFQLYKKYPAALLILSVLTPRLYNQNVLSLKIYVQLSHAASRYLALNFFAVCLNCKLFIFQSTFCFSFFRFYVYFLGIHFICFILLFTLIHVLFFYFCRS